MSKYGYTGPQVSRDLKAEPYSSDPEAERARARQLVAQEKAYYLEKGNKLSDPRLGGGPIFKPLHHRKRSFLHKRAGAISLFCGCLFVASFFSKPIYDVFVDPPKPNPEDILRGELLNQKVSEKIMK